ncbi:MAG: C40 family peptidase [Cytophagales bacterium]|jgi:cell wall-associated NlpC family hydrolase|nr:C40 family peptidase [Cytophagales bacterium]
MKLIADQLWVVLRELALLGWIVLRETGRGLAWLGRWLYAHRWQIARHRATPWVAATLAFAVAFWAFFRQNQAHEPVVFRQPPDSVRNAYFLLANQPFADEPLRRSIQGWLGVPHRDGGNSHSGTDCSGFVQNVYTETYRITLSRNARQMYERDVTSVPRDALQEGDLVFFDTFGGGVSHVGIYLQGGRFAHASTSRGVTIDSLGNRYFDSCYYGGGRVKGRWAF